MRIDKANIAILDALLSNPEIKTKEISQRLGVPLSTVQRRRSLLERKILVKNYSVDVRQLGWRTADLFVSVEKGNSERVAGLLLTKENVLTTSLRVGHPEVNVAAQIFFRNTGELHELVESIRAIPDVKMVEWSEVVRTLSKKQTRLVDSIFERDSLDDH